MSIIFGNLTESFINFGTAVANVGNGSGSEDQVQQAAVGFRHSASQDASFLVYIGLGMLVATFVYMYTWVYSGEMVSKRIRERYLKVRFVLTSLECLVKKLTSYLQAVLRQDVAYFDNVGAGEIASRIQTDTRKFFLSRKSDSLLNSRI